jgi:hypothetical protein
MKIKTIRSSPTAGDITIFSQEPETSEGEGPLVITISGTPHPHQPEPKAHPKARVRPHPQPWCSRLGHQSVIAAARSRDRDPLT